jgi:hypothetical protein
MIRDLVASTAGEDKISANLFGCSTARNKGTCSNWLNIRRDVLESTILGALKTPLMHPDLVAEFARAFTEEVNRSCRRQSAERESAKARRDRAADRSHRHRNRRRRTRQGAGG